MNAEVREALEGSILKWERIVDYLKKEDADWLRVGYLEQASGNCPLCQLKSTKGHGRCATLCPVVTKTGLPGCRRTPYYQFVTAEIGRNLMRARKAAKAELKFLKSLRRL